MSAMTFVPKLIFGNSIKEEEIKEPASAVSTFFRYFLICCVFEFLILQQTIIFEMIL